MARNGHARFAFGLDDVGQHKGRSDRVLRTIELELDKYGSPVPLEPEAWYVCFVPGLVEQWWQRFVNRRHTHVFAMKPTGPGEWLLLEPWRNRILTTTITSEQARKFLLWGAPAVVSTDTHLEPLR